MENEYFEIMIILKGQRKMKWNLTPVLNEEPYIFGFFPSLVSNFDFAVQIEKKNIKQLPRKYDAYVN